MARKKQTRPAPSSPVDAITHKDARTNIPTRELAGFAADDEAAPPAVLYPRDPSLDPQLVWKGKDEQDRNPLEVPAVPVYIQEKIQPRAIIEDLRQRAAAGKPKPRDLFSDFNGLDDFEKRVDFYHHDQHWSNRMILGNSLHVMTSLAEKERLKGRVQMIYMDPPYGIKFGSNWQVSTRKRDVKDAGAEDVTRQPEQIQAFRDTWALGIHSYLPYLRDRLVVARDLLTESGSVFVQIGDENVHLVRCVMDEVFGSENAVSLITVSKTGSLTGELLSSVADYLLWYAKDRKSIKYHKLFNPRGDREEDAFTADPLKSDGYRKGTTFDFVFEGKIYPCKQNEHWKVTRDGLNLLAKVDRLVPLRNSLRFKKYFVDFPVVEFTNIWHGMGGASDMVYVVQTSPKIIERCLLMTTDAGDLVLDPTCGSGTTAYVAEQWGRRWITIDTSRVALALARTRLMAARFPFYLLTDSPEGRKKEAELFGVVGTNVGWVARPTDADATPPTGVGPDTRPADPITSAPVGLATHPTVPPGRDIRRGFVTKRVPHVTLKSIANNPDIKEGMTREEIDAAIRKHAETEILYDQPYEDKGVVRVAGPFSVESLSPHRMLPTAGGDEPRRSPDEAPRRSPDQGADAGRPPDDYLTTILDNLRKAGVQNTVKKERLVFDRLDVFPGEYIQAEGTYTENGATKAVRVSVGPEFGTVGPEWMQKAALEAIKGSQCELVLVCGFAFDPHVSEQTQELKKEMRFGKVRILAVRMNPDLSMGDELLKKTGSGNLFMVFGEPDIDLKKQKDGRLVAEVRGVDVYDPTTGAVRSHSTDDIACWFLDTDYNGESFFVRHAYFCGGDEPYEKLRKALRAEIDEAEWAKLYSTKSLPFDPPTKGKIAVKVINHYGDEVLKVYRAP